MKRGETALAARGMRRLFFSYALATLLPVLILGAALLVLVESQGDRRGLAEARSKSALIAVSLVAPHLSGADLRNPLSAADRLGLTEIHDAIGSSDQIARLRVRDLSGRIVGAADSEPADPDALRAAAGATVSQLTYLNADADTDGDDTDTAGRGPRSVEIYRPLYAVGTQRRIGVLELYLPYAPIAADIAQGQFQLELVLSIGLVLLWISTLIVSGSVARRLHRQSRQNAYLATHDQLTGLPNRAHFVEAIADAAMRAHPDGHVAVAVLDLDRFKQINDTLGPANGDLLLVALAERISNEARSIDVIARLGGDEFGVLLTGLPSAEDALVVFARLRRALSTPILVGDISLAVEASVGFAVVPGEADPTDPEELLQQADVAMYVAKRQHRGIVQYRREHAQYDAVSLSLIAELGRAIAEDQLVLHFQPKADFDTGRVNAVEALVRWQHPVHGLLYPDSFLPAAEQTELIDALTEWVIVSAANTLPSLGQDLSVAVNVSARSLIRPHFADEVLALIAATPTAPNRVILEVTETALLDDPARAHRTLQRLHDAGFRIAIDDFGAGQTSLSYLATMPVSELKIDKAFVLSMSEDPRNAAIVRSVIELGHSLGFRVTAEGVETEQSMLELERYGCDTAQGYLLSRPVPAAQLRDQLALQAKPSSH